MNTSDAILSDAQFALLRTLIAERSGLEFPAGRKYVLESRLASRLAELGLEGFDQYLRVLDADASQTGELCELFSQITINETGFFRDAVQFEAFERLMLPAMLASRAATRRLRIWSAACSTGQEAYTIAMIVDRVLGAERADWSVDILGTDLSPRVLEIARAGRYDELAIRGIPPSLVDSSFSHNANLWTIRSHLRAMIRFEQSNLLCPIDQRSPERWDFVFCRNTMIYFGPRARARVLREFQGRLAADGTLLVGGGESASGGGSAFIPSGPPDAHAYSAARARTAA